MASHFKQVTMTGVAAPVQLSTTSVRCKEVYLENNAGNVMRVGDSTANVTNSIGISLTAGGVPASVLHLGPHDAYNLDLSQIWVAGTLNDKLDVIWVA